MGILDGNKIQSILGRAFRGVYESGTLRIPTTTRQSDGTLRRVAAEVDCKVQFDECTESMKQQAGYSATDCRVIILRDGLGYDLVQVSADCSVVDKEGRTWKLNAVTTDPARSYFEARGSLILRTT